MRAQQKEKIMVALFIDKSKNIATQIKEQQEDIVKQVNCLTRPRIRDITLAMNDLTDEECGAIAQLVMAIKKGKGNKW